MQPGRRRDYGLYAVWAGRMSDAVDQDRHAETVERILDQAIQVHGAGGTESR